MLSHTLHQFHENDLFTSAAAMSYFGLMALFPALLLLLAISNKLAAGSQMLAHAVDVYPGMELTDEMRAAVPRFSRLAFASVVALVLTGIVNYTELNSAAPMADALKAVGYDWIASLVSLGALAGLVILVSIAASAIVAGLRGSSSGMPASTLPTRSAPTSAALGVPVS